MADYDDFGVPEVPDADWPRSTALRAANARIAELEAALDDMVGCRNWPVFSFKVVRDKALAALTS